MHTQPHTQSTMLWKDNRARSRRAATTRLIIVINFQQQDSWVINGVWFRQEEETTCRPQIKLSRAECQAALHTQPRLLLCNILCVVVPPPPRPGFSVIGGNGVTRGAFPGSLK